MSRTGQHWATSTSDLRAGVLSGRQAAGARRFRALKQCALARRQSESEDHRAARSRALKRQVRLPALCLRKSGKAQQALEIGALGVDSDKDGNDFVLDIVMTGNSKAALDRADAAYIAFLKAH